MPNLEDGLAMLGEGVPAFRAFRYGYVFPVATLLGKNPGLARARDERGNTLLHHAAAHGNFVLAELLLGFGAEADARNLRGATPLHVAVMRGMGETARLLALHDADTALLRARSGEA